MKTYTLDNIVRNALVDKGYTMHWYLNFLTYAIDGFRELNFDSLQNIKSVRLPVNSYKAATLPCDFVDYIRVGSELGQYINPFGEKRDSFNRLNNFDDLGDKIPYSDTQAIYGVAPNNWESFWYSNYINDKGEHMGRIFNAIPTYRNSFSIIRERGEIQLDTSYLLDEIYMDYVTDGTSTDSTTAIHPYAIDSIKSYIFWKHKEHSRQYNLQERDIAKQEFYNQNRILRARLNTMDVIDIRRSLAYGFSPVIKN